MSQATKTSPYPLAVDSKGLAELLQVSERHVRNMQKDGTLGPQPLHLGRSVRYSVPEVQRWLVCGARTGRLPDRRAWAAMKRAGHN